MFFISGFSLFMFIIVYVTLYLIYLMKNAIEAEKAKSAKIENDLKLEIEKLKAEKEAKKSIIVNFSKELKSQQAIIIDLKSATTACLAAEKATIVDLKSKLEQKDNAIKNLEFELEVKNEALLDSSALLAGKCTLTIYLKDKLAAQQSIISDLEPQQTIVADLKSKLYCRNVTIRSFKCELEHKDKVIERLYAIINKR